MKTKAEWYETFFDGLYGRVLAGQFEEARTAAQARTIKKALGLRKGRRVLDCPCGLGRITLALAKLGLEVAGADLAAGYLRRARRRAKTEGLDIRFVRCDMRELPFDREFDAVVSWFSSFGYFGDAGNLAAAKAAFGALRPGGRFLVELINKSSLLRRFRRGSEERINGVRVVHANRWDARTSRVQSTWTLSRGAQTHRHRLSMRLYNGAEIRALLHAAGLREIQLFGHPPLARLTRHSRRLIAVGRRSKKNA